MFECRVGTPLAVAALAPGLLKHGKEVVYINHFHVSLAHTSASVLTVTAKQHEIRLTGELVLCSTCSRTQENRDPTTLHSTRRAMQPLGLAHIDTTGPYLTSLGGSRYVVMFVDSTSRLQWPHGARENSTAAIYFCRETLGGAYGNPTRVPLTTAQSIRTVCSWTFATVSEFVASLRNRISHSRMNPSRARYRKLLRLYTLLD